MAEPSLGWIHAGTTLFLGGLAELDDEALSAPSTLPEWSRRQLVAHVAANASALVNLTKWALTGVETPMYASGAQRAADIEAGAQRPPAELRQWVVHSAAELDSALATLSPDQWNHQVRTAQGRAVAATEIPWMRAREVMVHAVDLGSDTAFADLPEPFLLALIDDIVGRRENMPEHPTLRLDVPGGRSWTIDGDGPAIRLSGSVPDTAAYLAGRSGGGIRAAHATIPALPPWL